jgi:hypothetical protein
VFLLQRLRQFRCATRGRHHYHPTPEWEAVDKCGLATRYVSNVCCNCGSKAWWRSHKAAPQPAGDSEEGG